jgi:dihydrodipicolinate synthase/N-acetylneuraminate lyase
MPEYPVPGAFVQNALRRGMVIPACPLALTSERKFDERRQRALTRYYFAAGAGGLAAGVHTTQFEIRDPKIGLFKPVLELVAQTLAACEQKSGRAIVKIAGICGETKQAVTEADFAVTTGYHAGLLSLSALKHATLEELMAHCQTVAQVIPLVGFYLQPAVGGRVLGFDFWRRFVEIPNVVAIKIAPFNRYYTLDVVRAVAEAGRANDLALYTGNDDNIVLDLLTTYQFTIAGNPVRLRIVGGLLGHWAVWTKKAVELLEEIHRLVDFGAEVPQEMLTRAVQVTDCNAAFFDPVHNFAGGIAGIHEVLRRQGLLAGRWCLNPNEDLSPGQMEEIDRVYAAYPQLNDDAFVAEQLEEWLRP